MRDIFFEDEIDNFSETVHSILTGFVSREDLPDVTQFLHEFNNDIRRGFSNEDIIMTIQHLRERCLEFNKKHLYNLALLEVKVGIEIDFQQIDKDLQDVLVSMNNEKVTQLIHVLSELVYAVQNKDQYLKVHQDELIALEKDEAQQCDWFGESRLMLAIKRNNVSLALNFIERHLFINRKNRGSQTPLMIAARSGLDVIITALLQHGADLNVGEKRPYQTALYYAITYGKISTANLLISAGAKVYFEWTRKVDNKTEVFSLIEYAKKGKINLKLPEDNVFALNNYVMEVLKNDPPCSSIMQWLRDHQCELKKFLCAYTVMKHGTLDEACYEEVRQTFKAKHQAEIEKAYLQRPSHLFPMIMDTEINPVEGPGTSLRNN